MTRSRSREAIADSWRPASCASCRSGCDTGLAFVPQPVTTPQPHLLTTYSSCATESPFSHRGRLPRRSRIGRVGWLLLALSPSHGLFDIVRDYECGRDYCAFAYRTWACPSSAL